MLGITRSKVIVVCFFRAISHQRHCCRRRDIHSRLEVTKKGWSGWRLPKIGRGNLFQFFCRDDQCCFVDENSKPQRVHTAKMKNIFGSDPSTSWELTCHPKSDPKYFLGRYLDPSWSIHIYISWKSITTYSVVKNIHQGYFRFFSSVIGLFPQSP